MIAQEERSRLSANTFILRDHVTDPDVNIEPACLRYIKMLAFMNLTNFQITWIPQIVNSIQTCPNFHVNLHFCFAQQKVNL